MTGTLQKKKLSDGKEYYYMVLNLYDQKTGKRKQKWIATGYSVTGNKKKAEILLRETLNRYDDKAVHYGSDMLFSDYIEVWLSRIKAEVVATTYEGYALHSKSVVEYFRNKKLKLTDLRAKHFSEFYNYQLKEGKVNKRTKERSGYSVRTVRSQKLIINSALNMAVEDEIISRNPALQVRVTNKSKKKIAKEIQFFTGEELNEFLEFLYSQNDPLTDLIVATTYFGLRRSEVLGLRQQALDIEGRKLTISHTVVKITTVHDDDKTKTPDSARVYSLTDEMVAFFRNVMEKKEKNKEFYGNTYVKSDFLFTWEDGKLFAPDYVYHHFKKLVTAFGRPKFTFHNLRHTTASILYERGWQAKDIQEWLGHADYYTTMNIYTHIARSHKEEKAESLNGMLILPMQKC